jgi:hypothetical protein
MTLDVGEIEVPVIRTRRENSLFETHRSHNNSSALAVIHEPQLSPDLSGLEGIHSN